MVSPAWIVRLRPSGPWRPGSPTGERDLVDRVLHSDTLFSALTWAFENLGLIEEWLDATVRAESPAVRLSSCFPYLGRHLLAPVPRNVWPPPTAGKVRWKSVRFIPLSLIGSVLRGELPNEDRWLADPISQCLLPIEKNGVTTEPFRVSSRSAAAVDRMTQASAQVRSTACLEFHPDAGFWCTAVFNASAVFDEWGERMRAAFRLLADTGMGGERSSGWGGFYDPQLEKVEFPNFFYASGSGDAAPGYWLLSLFQPGSVDGIDWEAGSYSLLTRSGRMDPRSGSVDRKLAGRMVEEGSVMLSANEPVGMAVNVAPTGSDHPSYRAGFAVAVPVPHRTRHMYGRLPAAPEGNIEEEAAAEPPQVEPQVEPAAEAEPESGEEELQS